MDISVLLSKMLIFVVLMLIGYFFSRLGLCSQDFTRSASQLVLNVFMTGTILSSMITTGSQLNASNLGEIILITFVMTAVGYLVSVLATRVVRVEGQHAAVYEILMGVGNSMFIALPIAEALYGSYAVLICSISCIPFNLFLYTYGVWRLKGSTGRLRLKDMFSVPLISTLFGLALILLHIPVPNSVRGVLTALSGATMPMSMIVIGASLGSVSLLDAFKNPKLAFLSFVRLILVPIVTWLVCRPLTGDNVLLMTGMLIAAAPSAVIITVIAIQYGHDSVFPSEAVQHSTICSIVTIPLLIQIFSHLS